MNALIIILACIAADPTAPASALKCDVIDVHDGDTVKVTIHCPLLGIDAPNVSIRAYGYDAYEITRTRQTVTVTDAEIVKGKAARDDLAQLIAGGELWLEDSGQRDPYGRTSAWLWVKLGDGSWVFVPKYMDDHGHLRTPRPKQ